MNDMIEIGEIEAVIGDVGAMIGECARVGNGKTIAQSRGMYKPKTELGQMIRGIVEDVMEKVRTGQRIGNFMPGDRVLSNEEIEYTFIAPSHSITDFRDPLRYYIVADDEGNRIFVLASCVDCFWTNLTTTIAGDSTNGDTTREEQKP